MKRQHPLDAQVNNREDAVRLVLGKPFNEKELEEITKPEVEEFKRSFQLNAEDVVLEIGCGVGRFASLLCPLVKEYHGVDIAQQMVHHAQLRTRDLENAFFVRGNGRDLSTFEDGQFSFVFSTISLIHMDVEDVFGYLLESYRCLRRGGRAYFDFLNLCDDRVQDKWLASYTLPRDPETGEKDPYRTRFMTPEEVRLYLHHAGFRIRKIVQDVLIRAYCVKEAERDYDGAFRQEAEENREQRLRLLTDKLEAIYGSRSYRFACSLRKIKNALFGKVEKQ